MVAAWNQDALALNIYEIPDSYCLWPVAVTKARSRGEHSGLCLAMWTLDTLLSFLNSTSCTEFPDLR